MSPYVMMLCRVDHTATPVKRTRMCGSDEEAVDSAARWLRLHRNTSQHIPRPFDRWVVARLDAQAPAGFRLVATSDE